MGVKPEPRSRATAHPLSGAPSAGVGNQRHPNPAPTTYIPPASWRSATTGGRLTKQKTGRSQTDGTDCKPNGTKPGPERSPHPCLPAPHRYRHPPMDPSGCNVGKKGEPLEEVLGVRTSSIPNPPPTPAARPPPHHPPPLVAAGAFFPFFSFFFFEMHTWGCRMGQLSTKQADFYKHFRKEIQVYT
jgi:hypothetical protein